jgi:hypothetical protein
MDSFKSIITAAADGKISLRKAEYLLRGALGSGETGLEYQEIYNYLDEVAGEIDWDDETPNHLMHFTEFLVKVGFPDKFKG